MMSRYVKIDDHFEIPRSDGRRMYRGEFYFIGKRMRIGESVTYPDERSARRLKDALRMMGRKTSLRKVPNIGWRVWRVPLDA